MSLNMGAVGSKIAEIWPTFIDANNIDLLTSLAYNISDPFHKDYGKYLTTEEINNYVKPDEEDTHSVLLWLMNNNVDKFNFEFLMFYR